MRGASVVFGVSVVLGFVAACGSSGGGGGGGNGTCASVAGTWTLSGTCPASNCAISQAGCTINLNCDSGQYSGSVSSSGISFSDGQGSSCSGSYSGKSASGSCTDSAGTCTWNASCLSGSCGTSGSGGGGGSGGGSGGGGGGVDCNAACSVITSCCTGMPMSECLTGCQEASPSAACQACLQTPACGSLVPCVVSNCGVPSSFCAAEP